MTPLESLERVGKKLDLYGEGFFLTQDKIDYDEIKKSLQALEIIKKHILNRDMDTSGIYLVFQSGGHYEPYYTIEIREGIKQYVSIEEYELLKEVLK